MGYPRPPLTRGSPTAPVLMPEGSKAWQCTTHRAASAHDITVLARPSRVVKNGLPFGTSAITFVSADISFLLVHSPATWKNGATGSHRSNLPRYRCR